MGKANRQVHFGGDMTLRCSGLRCTFAPEEVIGEAIKEMSFGWKGAGE
jgi:hypothetical protein